MAVVDDTALYPSHSIACQALTAWLPCPQKALALSQAKLAAEQRELAAVKAEVAAARMRADADLAW
jgi:hypothetical protein